MNRIDAAFARLRSEGKKAFVAYVAAGDPSFDASLALEFMGFGGPDVQEGIASLRARRPPNFG